MMIRATHGAVAPGWGAGGCQNIKNWGRGGEVIGEKIGEKMLRSGPEKWLRTSAHSPEAKLDTSERRRALVVGRSYYPNLIELRAGGGRRV
jgi:hypothetical protein